MVYYMYKSCIFYDDWALGVYEFLKLNAGYQILVLLSRLIMPAPMALSGFGQG
jgi:hypothetical protein